MWKIILLLALIVSPVQAATYSLRTPVPTETAITGAVSAVASYGQLKVMWTDSDSRVHILCSMANGPFWTHHVSINTNGTMYAHAMSNSGVPNGQLRRIQMFDSARNKLYTGTEYHDGLPGSALMFDPVTQAWTVIKTGTAYGTASSTAFASNMSMDLGDDGLVYMTFIPLNYTGMRVYSYNPDVGAASWYDYGIIYNADGHADGAGVYNNSTSVDNQSIFMGVDSSYIYAEIQGSDTYYHLRVHPIGAGSWSEVTFGDGLASTSMRIVREISTNYICLSRTPLNGSPIQYRLTGGGATPYSFGAYRDSGADNYQTTSTMSMNGFSNTYGYDVDVWDVFPTPLPTNSIITWQPHGAGSPPFAAQSSLSYTGAFASDTVCGLATNSAPGEITSVAGGQGSGSGSDYNTMTQVSGAAFNALDAYGAIGVPAAYSPLGVREVYWVSYPDSLTRWTPSVGLTRNNPKSWNYQTQGVGQFAYPNIVDYDANGLIWIGGNVCGATQGCQESGKVVWYNPVNDMMANVFDGIWIGGNPPATGHNNILFTSLCMANNRSKVAVSSNDGYIHVIDCATQSIVRSDNIGVYGYLTEVSDDLVMGITYNGSSSQLFRYRPSTGTVVTSPTNISTLGIPGITNTFGGVSSKHRKLERGLDGYAWLFVDGSIYRVNPTTTDANTFTKIVDTATYGIGKIRWSGLDLLAYYDGITSRSGVDAYLGLLIKSTGHLISGVEGVNPFGIPGVKFPWQ